MSRLIISIYIPRRYWSRHSMHLKGPSCPSRTTAGLRSLSTAFSFSRTEGSSSRLQNLFGSEDYSDDRCDLGRFFWSEAVLEASCVDEAAGDVAGQVAESQGYAA